jgi:type I restriction enzyme S subunit
MSVPIVRLEQIAASIDYGYTASAVKAPVGPKLLRITDIQDDQVDWRSVPFCTRPKKDDGSCELAAGDIVFARTGATTGKSFLIRTCPDNAVFASYLIRVRLKSVANPQYVNHFFKTSDYWRQIRQNSTGTAQPGVNASNLKLIKLPLPEIAKQRRIAAILDQADALRAKRRSTLDKLDSLATVHFLNAFGHPATNSRYLPIVPLRELGIWRSGGTPPRTRQDYFEGDLPWFSSGELNSMYVQTSSESISRLALTETSAKLVPKGALMLGMYDTAALKASIASIECSCNQAVAFCEIATKLASTTYVYFAIVIGRDHFRRQQRGVRQKNLNLDMIQSIPIPLPELALQRKFESDVDRLIHIRAAYSASLAKLDSLFASLQYRAFRGEL